MLVVAIASSIEFVSFSLSLSLFNYRLLELAAMGELIVSSKAMEEKREQGQAEVPAQSETIYNWRFVIILTSLAITSLLTAIESTVTSTALPIISADLFVTTIN